jgi:hypothetical protein
MQFAHEANPHRRRRWRWPFDPRSRCGEAVALLLVTFVDGSSEDAEKAKNTQLETTINCRHRERAGQW